MAETRDGGPAFPQHGTQPYRHDAGCGDTYTVAGRAGAAGMSLRDWFAGQALAGLCAASSSAELRKHTAEGILIVPSREGIPVLAFEYADSMLANRQKQEG